MKNKVVFTAVFNEQNQMGVMMEKNFVPSNDRRLWQLHNSATNFMTKFKLLKITVYVPDIAVNRNFVEVVETLKDIE